jgi:hypothetical protein
VTTSESNLQGITSKKGGLIYTSSPRQSDIEKKKEIFAKNIM